jgi:type I restriction enzyme M protein
VSAHPDINWITNFLWGIADDVLRDVYVRGKYRDVILPMVVLHRLDAVLQPTKQDVLEMHGQLNEMGITEQEAALRKAAGLPFYNTSRFSLKDLRNRTSQQQLRDDFADWLDGFSKNVQDILENFEFRNQIPRLSKADALGTLIEKFLNPDLKLAELDNHAMGTVFEELVRRFNEANNEEAGEHWTPRDVVKLMANLVIRPVEDRIQPGTYLLYDAAIGTGGMLTVAEQTLRERAEAAGKKVSTHLYGQEINPETYAICKADLMISGEGEDADNIFGGAEYSTLSNDAFTGKTFDFMLSNPPYGKSWKTDLETMGGKDGITDPRFIVSHGGDNAFSLLTRSSDGQMLFLANVVAKMKRDTLLGSRVAQIHSGSSLFTGEAGQGESNVRRYLFENDLVEAIIQLPPNMFYNTDIATYIWVLANKKDEHRKGKVQLIDASAWFTPMRKNLGNKSCELSADDLERILTTYLAFEEAEGSKIFDNAEFGHTKVRVERPLRLRSRLDDERIEQLRWASGDTELRHEIHQLVGDDVFTDFDAVQDRVGKYLDSLDDEREEGAPVRVTAAARKRLCDAKRWARDHRLHTLARRLADELGEALFEDHNVFAQQVDTQLLGWGVKLSAADRRTLLRTVSWTDPAAPAVVRKTAKAGKVAAGRLHGRFEVASGGETLVVEYEPDPQLRDFELVPLGEPGGVAAFMAREVLPYAPDAWVVDGSGKIGYEVSFAKVFYKPTELRTLEEIEADIRHTLAESDGLVLAAIGGNS